MLVEVALLTLPDGRRRGVAPVLPGCEIVADTEDTALPMLRLAVEQALTDRLARGAPLPISADDPSAPPVRGTPGLASARWMSVHLNLAHLVALAAHQPHR